MDVKAGFHDDIGAVKHKHDSNRSVYSRSFSTRQTRGTEDAHNTRKSVSPGRTNVSILLALGLMFMPTKKLLL